MSGWQHRFSIENRRALVTGASRGIGAEICTVFAEAGADIIAVARDPAGLADTAKRVHGFGRDCQVIEADLSTAQGCKAAAQQALDRWGVIDILVNSAGIARTAPALELTAEDWDATMALNLRAPFLMAQALAPAMIDQRWGKIINISSQTGVIALDDHAAYASSKGGLNALTKSLCAEWARFNVQVNAICPTVVMTPMGREIWGPEEKSAPFIAATPLRRFGEPVEIADAALYLASPASELVNGHLLMVEGGFTSV
ncbi:SDR family NAD(P)-dependent oxidoreductase [Rhodovulum marinum]|uniref:NAD(P)-dependent dehydrogenase (Short-subunit alcohol dehydrogenase family) n=1 Tax=Rhodovulum marinum TaxID=320662 RepID=A0A4R2Q3C9_9RHOB|nr:SDR family NAD(P)-dependent oxidoreductase [Rhodovulum marinum]TCP43243.1 NAD(P)-dependent dehydrogenase (short-subunit alcohol dehydrogenase family) [Rhodovulum marinum]